MSRLLKTLLFWTLVLGACSLGISSPQLSPAPNEPSQTPIPPSEIAPTSEIIPTDELPPELPSTEIFTTEPGFTVTVSTPHIYPGPNGEILSPNVTLVPPPSTTECGYQWAYQDLPELTAQFDQAVKNLIPYSTSHATAFGENCIGNDGQVVRFLAMETDFYVIVSVVSLNDYETFGDWIVKVMQLVNGYPTSLIAGPKPGFVEFRFEKNPTESIGFRVPIQQYNETAVGRTGEELFRMFYTAP